MTTETTETTEAVEPVSEVSETTATEQANPNEALEKELQEAQAKIKALEENNKALLSEKLLAKDSEKASKTEAEQVAVRATHYEALLQKHLGQDTLKSELLKSGVKPELVELASSTLMSQVSITEDNGQVKATFAETQTIAEGVKDFVETETGKAMLASPNSIGGGAGTIQRNNKRSVADNKPTPNDFLTGK